MTEDPFVYTAADQDGSKIIYHAVFHNQLVDDDERVCGSHAHSEDGLTWTLSGTAWGNVVEFEDGERYEFSRRERPHLIFTDPDNPSKITGLTTGVMYEEAAPASRPGEDACYTLLQKVSSKTDDVPAASDIQAGDENLVMLPLSTGAGVLLKRGWNLGNTLEGCSPSTNPNGEWVFETVAAAGFDWVRIPAQWGCHALETAPYTVDAAFLAQVNQTVRWALKHKLRAMVNTHHENKWIDTTNTTIFAAALPRLVAIWTQISGAFASYSDDVLVYELFNEPNKMSVDQLNQMNAALLPPIRATNPTRQVHLGGLANMNSGWILSHTDAMAFPKADKHLALTVHSCKRH